MEAKDVPLQYDHVQMYVDELRPLEEYLELTRRFNELSTSVPPDAEVADLREAFVGAGGTWREFTSVGQDVVRQLICGFGFRIVAHAYGPSTQSVVVSSSDRVGAKFVITAAAPGDDAEEPCVHFRRQYVADFMKNHSGAQGIGVLALRVGMGGLDVVRASYKASHPNLLCPEGVLEYKVDGQSVRIFEVYMYYKGEAHGHPDAGTRLRFVETDSTAAVVMPGLTFVANVSFDMRSEPCYSDHWVSNVFNREQVLKTFEEALGFTPKVDFNAGVVAAGEAVIESTVTGNNLKSDIDANAALTDQTQVYFPINNAISNVGHVHLYLEQLGQGVQHLAQRVPDLVDFISYANVQRAATGEGFNFLGIPRSYYGRLTEHDMRTAGLSEELARAVEEACRATGVCNLTNIVKMDVAAEEIERLPEAAQAAFSPATLAEFQEKRAQVVEVVKRARYTMMYKLLGDHLSEERYLSIVENKILVDIQGNDILYQIFTAPILQKQQHAEAPFLEFIQRKCSEKVGPDGKPLPVRAGCGGFGVRNFLTLFLSIEVSKAMHAAAEAAEQDNKVGFEIANKMIACLSNQLEESNPILTSISDAMTAEAEALDLLPTASPEEKEALEAKLAAARKAKEDKQEELKACSHRYKEETRKLREAAAK